MTVSWTAPGEYQFSLYYAAVDNVLPGGSNLSLTTRNINPDGLLSISRRQQVIAVPETDGGILRTDGFRDADPMLFYGEQYDDGNHSEGLFTNMAVRVSQLIHSTQFAYILASLYDGSSTKGFRRYGAVRSINTTIKPKSMYRVQSFEMIFDVLDPWWYYDTANSDTISVVAGTGNKAVVDTGTRDTNRLLTYITKTGASNPTNPTISNSDGDALTITGSLTNVNDFWTIDHYAGTVKKSVLGVVSDDTLNASGKFLSVDFGSDTITCTDTAAATFTVSLFWLERRM